MRVLLLSPYPDNVVETLKKEGDSFIIYNNVIKKDYLKDKSIDFIISYGYSHIISKEVLNYMNNKVINLHISYLPFNKGSHPNLWSHIEGTPSGISIHTVDEGIDTGEILFRSELKIEKELHTFESSYKLLREGIESLFADKWKEIRVNNVKGFFPKEIGTFHYKKDSEVILSKLDLGWKTNISEAIKIINDNNI